MSSPGHGKGKNKRKSKGRGSASGGRGRGRGREPLSAPGRREAASKLRDERDEIAYQFAKEEEKRAASARSHSSKAEETPGACSSVSETKNPLRSSAAERKDVMGPSAKEPNVSSDKSLPTEATQGKSKHQQPKQSKGKSYISSSPPDTKDKTGVPQAQAAVGATASAAEKDVNELAAKLGSGISIGERPMATGHLHSLCRQGSVSKIQSYLEEAGDIHNKLEERLGFLGYTPLHEAANEGRIDVVRLLLENGANANAEANGQYTPLHIAASIDNVDCVVELLKHNADITKESEFGTTPYSTAVIMKCKKAAQILKTEEIKEAARENRPNLKDLLTSISGQDILPSCFKDALLEASSCGHVDAICSLVLAGANVPLYLRDCIIQALRLDFCEAAATLLMCYAAKHDERRLLKYLMGEETSREEGEQAILELPCPSVPRNTMAGIRLFIANKEVFPTAVPLELALQRRRKEAAEIILLNTGCDRQRRQVDWGNLAMGEIEPAWLENIKWVETILLVSNFLQRVPDNIYILNKLSCLDLRKNQLKTIPVCLLEMTSLCNLWLSENKIAELPKQCNWSSSLKTLDLNDNLLETLPKSMAKAKLTSLHVARNNLYYLPPWIEQMASLQLLDVSGNPRLKNVTQKLEKLNQTKSDSLIGENHQEADFFTDLDKLYLAMAEVGIELNFNILVYSLGITSINALKDFKSKDTVILHPDEVNAIKKKLVNTSLKFDQLAQKYEQSNVVKTCQMKGIPVIRKQDIVVTRTITCGQMAGYVCEAEWIKPGGIKEKVCLRYGETEKQLFLHEAEMANSFRHKCILDFHGVVIASSFSPYVALVEEFAEYGNLDKASEHHSVERLCRFTVQAASALEYLESKNVVHQLLQLYCMVVSDYQLKLAGIGYCEFLNDTRRKRASGSPYSLPEEVVYIFAKLFSTAFISYQNRASGFEAAETVMDTSLNLRSKHGYLCPSHFCEVFDRCLQDNPKERPSFSEISQSLMAIENPLQVKVTRSFNAESAGFLSGETGELITLISKDRHREKKNVWLGETQSKEVGFFTAENVEEVPVSELTEDSSVPPEILARGPKAQRAYERALQIGKVKVYRGRIMILGQDRAGKTSLKKSLLGLPFDPQENSTIGVEVDPSRCELEVAQIKNWEPTERKKLDVSDFAEDMARLVARDLNETVDQQNVSTAGSPSQEELLHNNMRNAAAVAAATATESTPDTIMVEEMEKESSDDSALENSYQAELNIASTSLVPDDVTELVVQYLKNLKLEEDIKAREVVLTLWDFAGQHLYYASHSVFLSRRAIYILVYNLHKSICAKAKPRVRQGTHDVVLENPNNETNLDHLLSWLVSVHAIVPQADQVGKDLDSQATSVPYLRPPVIIVGTNADQPFEDPRATEKYIQRSVSGKTYEKHVIRPFFAVDNTKSNKDLGVQELRRKIIEVLNQEPYMGEEVPLRWFNFEKVVEALVAKGTYYMDLNQLLTVTRQVCRISDEDELTAMLNFYHDLGVIVKHGQTVVLQAQWLIDLFKQLITVRPFDEVDPLFSECWLELEQSGILRMALVDHIFAEFIQKGLSKQDILDMMEVYGLITKFSCSSAESGQEQTEFFVPSQLRSSPSGLCELKPSESDPCPLYLHFLDGFVPNGFFPQLLSNCIHWCSKQRLKGPPQLFQNGARLLIGVHDIFEFILLCRKRFIKVLLKKKTTSNSSAGTCATRLMAKKVRDSLEETLQSLSRELSSLCNLRYELCVLCTSCLQSSEQCRKHGLVSCDHDDCQHLLQVLPGEELFCLRSFCDNTVNVHGLEKWFHLTEADEAKTENGTAKASPVLDPRIVGCFAASTSVKDEVVMDRAMSFKSGVPLSSDLLLVASELGKSWKMLGRILCLSEPVLDQIEEDERQLTEKCYAVLLKWKQTVGPAASYECLAQALQHPVIGRSELATKYCRECIETEPRETSEIEARNLDSDDEERDCGNNKLKGHSENPRPLQQETNKDISNEPSSTSGPGDSRGDLGSAVSGHSSFLFKEISSLHSESCPKAEEVFTLKYPYPRGIAESSTYEKERVHSEWGKNQSSSVENKAYGVVQSTRYVDMEIRKLPYGILKKLSDQLDIDGLHDWEALISVMPTGMYSKEQVTSLENQRARMDGSPSMALLTDLGQRAKTVRQLVVWLKKIGNCQALDILEYKEKSDALDLEVLPPTFTTSEGIFKEEIIERIFTSEGGVMAGGNIRLVCPPGALHDSLSVTITLEDPSKYYSLIVQKDLENDVIIAAPIVNLQPNGHSFRKPIKLTTSFKNMNWKWRGDDVFILHGTEARNGKVTWQDITKSSKINKAAGEVEVELKHFSLIMVLLRCTLIRSKDILSRFDFLSFDYKLLVLLNKTSPSSAHDMLALLFVSQDVYHEQFFREDETSALVQLKKEGFIEVHEHATDRLDKRRIYNHENLQVSIQLGEDYRLSDSQHRSFSFDVDSFVWWNGGKVIKLPLKWRNEVRYLCGTICVNGENGHASKKHFSEGDLCNYVRKLLGMEGNIFNVVTIARLLEMPEELMHQVTSSWEDDCEQLNLSLQHWLEKSAIVENLSALRKCLEGINQEEYNVTSRGQMHIRRLRKLATKITDLQLVNTDLVRYFSRKATILCNSVLRDCCLELNQDKAFSSSNNADPLVKQFIENRQPMPEDISTKYKLVCSPSDESRTSIFLAIVPHLIQTIKEIFVDHKRLVPHSGLIGLREDNVNQLLTSVLNARQNNRFRDLVYVECQILEKLCLKNHNKKPVAEITKWSESLAIVQMLNFLERFFKHCLHDKRLHRRLEIFSCRLRDTLLTDHKEVDEDYMQDFANILLSLVDFAKFDPSKLVRFELIDSKNSTLSSTSSDVENVVHDEYDDTYSQTFSIKKVSEDELQLSAAACVHIYGSMRKIGAFQSIIMLNRSGMDAFNRCVSRFAPADIAVMKMEAENEHSGNLQTVLYASQKEKLSELIQIFKRELSEDMVDLSHSEVSRCYLSMRCIDFTKEKVLRLRLVYKWGSEAVALDSNDFVTFSDCSTGGACLPEVKSFGLDNSLMSEDFEGLSLTSVGGKFPSTSFVELQKHGSAHCGKIEYHLHQTFNQVISPHTCVIGNQATVNDQMSSQRALPEGLNCSPKRSITEGRRSSLEEEDSKDRL